MTVATLALPHQVPLIGTGQVRHTRYRPSRHAFAYGTWFLLLPMRSMALHGSGDLPVNRRALLGFAPRLPRLPLSLAVRKRSLR